jgi:hypothetical protein
MVDESEFWVLPTPDVSNLYGSLGEFPGTYKVDTPICQKLDICNPESRKKQ